MCMFIYCVLRSLTTAEKQGVVALSDATSLFSIDSAPRLCTEGEQAVFFSGGVYYCRRNKRQRCYCCCCLRHHSRR